MKLGFTGTQKIGPGEVAHVEHCLTELVERLKPTTMVTGECIGIDFFVCHWFAKHHPDIKRVVVILGD